MTSDQCKGGEGRGNADCGMRNASEPASAVSDTRYLIRGWGRRGFGTSGWGVEDGVAGLSVDVVGADIVVEHFTIGEEFEEDPMTIIDGVGPQTLEASLQRVGSQAGVKRILSEQFVSLSGEALKGRGQLAEGALEAGRDVDPCDARGRAGQDSSSFSDWTGRVLPRRCASRPASTISKTSSTVSRRFCWWARVAPSSTLFHGIRMISASAVMDTVGRGAAMVCLLDESPCALGICPGVQ